MFLQIITGCTLFFFLATSSAVPTGTETSGTLCAAFTADLNENLQTQMPAH